MSTKVLKLTPALMGELRRIFDMKERDTLQRRCLEHACRCWESEPVTWGVLNQMRELAAELERVSELLLKCFYAGRELEQALESLPAFRQRRLDELVRLKRSLAYLSKYTPNPPC